MGKHNRPASGSPGAPAPAEASAFVAAQPGPSAPAEDTASSAAPGDAGASPSSGSATPDAGSPGASATLSQEGDVARITSADGASSIEVGPDGILIARDTMIQGGVLPDSLEQQGQAGADVAKELASEMAKLAAPRVETVSLADHQDVVRQLEGLVAERDAIIAELRAALDQAHEAFTALARQEGAPAPEAPPLPPPPEGKARFVVRGPGSLHDGTRLVAPGEPVDLSLEDARSIREHLEPHPALDD